MLPKKTCKAHFKNHLFVIVFNHIMKTLREDIILIRMQFLLTKNNALKNKKKYKHHVPLLSTPLHLVAYIVKLPFVNNVSVSHLL